MITLLKKEKELQKIKKKKSWDLEKIRKSDDKMLNKTLNK